MIQYEINQIYYLLHFFVIWLGVNCIYSMYLRTKPEVDRLDALLKFNFVVTIMFIIVELPPTMLGHPYVPPLVWQLNS